MTVANQLCVEQRRAPRTPGEPGGECAARTIHRVSAVEGAGAAASRSISAVTPEASRGQRQLAAGDEIELPRLAPDFQHDGAERIAGKRVGGGTQRGLAVGARARSRAGADRGRVRASRSSTARRIRFPQNPAAPRPAARARDPPRDASDKTGRRRALMAFGKHFMHRGHREPAAQHRIRPAWPSATLFERVRIAGVSMRSMLPRRDASVFVRALIMRRSSGRCGPLRFWKRTRSWLICS